MFFLGGWRGWDGGMMKLWIFLGGYRKTGLFLGVISKHSRVFLKVKIQNWNILGVANFQ